MTFIFRFYSTLVVLVLLLCFSQYNIFIYLSQILDIDAPTSFVSINYCILNSRIVSSLSFNRGSMLYMHFEMVYLIDILP